MSRETPQRASRSLLPVWDRNVLLGIVTFGLLVFIAMWLTSAGFMPGARMYPRFVAGVGVLVAALALWRVWTGKEPRGGAGHELPGRDESVRDVYTRALKLVASIALYYLGILLFGFVLATAVYLVAFARRYGESWLRSVVVAAVCVTLVYVLDKTIDLFLPKGLLLSALF